MKGLMKPIIKFVLGDYIYLNLVRKKAVKKSKYYNIYLKHKIFDDKESEKNCI